MSVLRRLGRSRQGGSEESKLAIDELAQKIEGDFSTGTAAPDSTTPGTQYARSGASAGYYVKINGTWVQVGNVS